MYDTLSSSHYSLKKLTSQHLHPQLYDLQLLIVLLSYITHLEFAWIPSLNPISLFCLPFSTSSSTLRNSMNYIFFLPKRTFSIQFANLSLCYSSNLLFLFPYSFTSKIFFGSFILSSSIFKCSPPIYFSSLALH